FVLTNPTLNGLQAIDGTGALTAHSSGQAQWTLIPSAGFGGTLSAGRQYEVSAHINYRLGGGTLTRETLPETITVRPQPSLVIDYYVNRFVRGGTFDLDVVVTNNGNGEAEGLSISSAQPQIVENLSGLAISFQLTGSQVANGAVASSTTLTF